MLTYAGVFQLVLPRLDRLWLSERVAEALPPDTLAAAAGFHEPSLVFLLGTATRLTDGAGAARFLLTTPGAAAIVESAEEPEFDATLAAAGSKARLVTIVDGLNYSRGRPATLRVWELAGKP